MWNTSCESPLANKLQTHKSHSRLLRFDLKHVTTQVPFSASFQCLSYWDASLVLNNRNTSHFPLGQRSRGSCTCVWSQIPSCLFSQSGIGAARCQKRLWKRKTILSLLPFLSLLWTFLLLKTKTQQKLCVCACLLFKERLELIFTLFAAVKVHRGKETQQLHVKCQSRMIQAVTVQYNLFCE